jgi:hypothetical protein
LALLLLGGERRIKRWYQFILSRNSIIVFIWRAVLKLDYKGRWTCGTILFTTNCTAMRLDWANLIAVVCSIALMFSIGWWLVCFSSKQLCYLGMKHYASPLERSSSSLMLWALERVREVVFESQHRSWVGFTSSTSRIRRHMHDSIYDMIQYYFSLFYTVKCHST